MNAERDVSMMGRRDLFAFGKASDRRDRMRGCHEPPHQYFYTYLDLETSTTYEGPDVSKSAHCVSKNAH
jgi:hypothetical protein